MQPFDSYFKEKMSDTAFEALYESECNVCASTVVIFEKAELAPMPLTRLAAEVNAHPEELEALRDADHCNPELVTRLCRYLELPEPEKCPKRKPKN